MYKAEERCQRHDGVGRPAAHKHRHHQNYLQISNKQNNYFLLKIIIFLKITKARKQKQPYEMAL